MKARLAAAQVQAHQAYATKLGADTGLVTVKTREEQALADAQDAAARSPDALVAAVPSPAAPIPVEAPRADAPGTTGYGPQPGIVSPDAQATYDAGVKMHDAQVATLTKLWPVIVRSGNATQVIEALGKGEGLAGLSGGLVPGAKVDPNVQRVAGGLYTGSAPTTSTVWSPGDTAGQQAEAGKDLTVKAGEAQLPQYKDVPGVGLVRVQGATATPVAGAEAPTFGTTDKGLAQTVLSRLKAKLDSGQPLTALEKAQYDQANAAVLPEPVKGTKGETLYTRDPNNPNVLTPMTGQVTPPADPSGFGGLNSMEGVASKIVSDTSVKMGDPNYKPTPQEAVDYATAHTHLFGQKQNFEKGPDGSLNLITTQQPVPAGVLDPAEIFKRAGITAPAAVGGAPPVAPAPTGAPPIAPSASGSPPVVPAPSGLPPVAPAPAGSPPSANPIDNGASTLAPGGNVRVQKILAGSGKPPTSEQQKDRLFLSRALLGTSYLDKMQPTDIPDALTNWFANSDSKGILQAIGDASLGSDTRNFITAKTAYSTAQLRDESGAAINSGEFKDSDKTYAPRPLDNAEQLAQKQELRHAYIRGMLQNAYSGDPEGLQQAQNEIKAMGIDLTAHPERNPVPKSARDANSPPPKIVGGNLPAPAGFDAKTWSHLTLDEQKQYLGSQ